MKKAVAVNVMEILMGIGFLILASYNNLDNAFLKSLLGGIGAILLVVAVFDLFNRYARTKKARELRDKHK